MLSKKNTILALIVLTLMVMTTICRAEIAVVPGTGADDVKTMTIAEVFANKSTLKGKMVRVKGKVVKVSRNIMHRTWVHIKDGTGAAGSDKIIFRSQTQSAAVGSEVIAQGVVDTDLDFGFGYAYSILVEDATFTK